MNLDQPKRPRGRPPRTDWLKDWHTFSNAVDRAIRAGEPEPAYQMQIWRDRNHRVRGRVVELTATVVTLRMRGGGFKRVMWTNFNMARPVDTLWDPEDLAVTTGGDRVVVLLASGHQVTIDDGQTSSRIVDEVELLDPGSRTMPRRGTSA